MIIRTAPRPRQFKETSAERGGDTTEKTAGGTADKPATDWRCKCGRPRNPQHPDRCTAGHSTPAAAVAMGRGSQLQPGNLVAFEHGLRSQTGNLPPEQAELLEHLRNFYAESISDAGGVSETGVRERSTHHNRAIIQRSIHLLAAALETKGLFDKRGKLRIAWLQRLEGLVNTARQLDQLLGLERRQKRLPQSPTEALLQEAEHD